jgi:hypothetical protein
MPLYSMGLYGYECERISVGPFERGPIHIIWDGHDNADFPADCILNETGFQVESVLNVFLVDDPELASYFRQTYELPATYSAIQVDASASVTPRQLTWRWQSGQQTSEIHLVDDGTSTSPDNTGDRIYWQRGNGIGRMDFIQDAFSPDIGRLGYGTLYPPMLQSDTPQGEFAGIVDYITTTGPAVVRLYSDLLCKNPEPMG